MNGLSCNFPRVIKRTVACLLLTLLLGGCSTTFTYNQLDWLIPWYVDDYVDLSRDQKQEFAATLWKEYKEYQEEYLPRSEEEYIEENAKNLEDLLKRFIGRLSTEQKQQMQLAARSMQRFDAVWLEDRKDWLETLQPLLQRPQGWQNAVLMAHANRAENRPPQYQQIFDYNINVVTRAVANVLNEMSDKQHEHVLKEIESLRAKIRKLTGS